MKHSGNKYNVETGKIQEYFKQSLYIMYYQILKGYTRLMLKLILDTINSPWPDFK